MTSGDIITWALAAVIAAAFWRGLVHLWRNFAGGESDCCGGAGPECACCTKEETTAKERRQAGEAWRAIREEARRERRGAARASCPACADRGAARDTCPACEALRDEKSAGHRAR